MVGLSPLVNAEHTHSTGDFRLTMTHKHGFRSLRSLQPCLSTPPFSQDSLVPEVLRAAIHRQGLQGVHSHLGHDARQDFAVLPAIEWQIERWHKSLKGESIRPGTPLLLEDARRLVQGYVEHYNNVRLNSAIGYITPKDMLAGHQQEIQAERDRKLEAARKQRQIRRQQAA
jgi:Integrase core domain